MAVYCELFLFKAERMPFCYADLFLNQIKTCNEFRYRMLYLQTGVHFQEIKIQFFVEQKLDGTGTAVIGGTGHVYGSLAHLLSEFGGQYRTRRLFNQFLVAALNGAVALKQITNIAVVVGHQLYFNMPGSGNVFFDKHTVVAKRTQRFTLCHVHLRFKFFCMIHYAHAFSASAGAGFNQNRKTDFDGNLSCRIHIYDGFFQSGHQRHAKLLNGLFAGDLAAHQIHAFSRRTDKCDARLLQFGGKFGTLA